MKIISNKECYIQKCDLDYLVSNGVDVPNKVFNAFRNQDSDFVKIEDQESIDFIVESIIPSFEEINDLSYSKITRMMLKIKSDLESGFDSQEMTDEEIKEALLEVMNLKYLLKQLTEIIRFRLGLSSLKYPDVPNPNRGITSNGILNAAYSLNLDNILVYNIDGSKITDVDQDFCNIAYKLLMHDYIDTENIDLNYEFADKYLILNSKSLKLIKREHLE